MFTGLSAFPLTPLVDGEVDDARFAALVERLAVAGVDSIAALGSTGSFAYLAREQRRRVAALATGHAGETPVIVGISSLSTSAVLRLADDAQRAGAAAVLLAPMTYQQLSPDDVFGLYEDVTAALSIPLVVYDNPRTTHFTFTDDLYEAIAGLPRVASIKIPPPAHDDISRRVEDLRRRLPPHISIGISGDRVAVSALIAGCDVWYSVIGGTLPDVAVELVRLAKSEPPRAERRSNRLDPLWNLFDRHGSLRVIATIAEELGLVSPPTLPLPIRGLDDGSRAEVREAMR
ncbi:MAG: dihydrodipicolinate synthase family protein, partial [Aldersonia sp.]|nr:dihydrodipicolinate synthase family protein [Aldersonia sp.]